MAGKEAFTHEKCRELVCYMDGLKGNQMRVLASRTIDLQRIHQFVNSSYNPENFKVAKGICGACRGKL